MAQFLKKMNLKSMGCDPSAARRLPNDNDKMEIAVIGGIATGTKSGENRSGNSDFWTALQGTFEGVVLQTGEGIPTGTVYTSGLCFLPGGFQDLIEGQLAGSDGAMQVQFALKIYAQRSDKGSGAIGYRYLAEALQKPSAHDAMAPIRALMGEHTHVYLGPPPAPEQPVPPAPPVPPALEAPAPAKEQKKKH